MFVSLLWWNGKRCYLFRTSYLILKAFYFQQYLWVLQQTKLFCIVIAARTEMLRIHNGDWHGNLNLLHVSNWKMLQFVTSHMNQNKDVNKLLRLRSTKGKSSLKYFFLTKCTMSCFLVTWCRRGSPCSGNGSQTRDFRSFPEHFRRTRCIRRDVRKRRQRRRYRRRDHIQFWNVASVSFRPSVPRFTHVTKHDTQAPNSASTYQSVSRSGKSTCRRWLDSACQDGRGLEITVVSGAAASDVRFLSKQEDIGFRLCRVQL